jgi:hypothetical protein
MKSVSARGIDVSLAEATRVAARFAGGDHSPARCARRASPAWVPIALVALDFARRLLSEIHARSGCDTTGGCTR